MRRAVLALALCCLCRPAMAADAERMFLNNRDLLKPPYRQCLSHYDCTFIQDACGDLIAVNKSSRAAAEVAVLSELPKKCAGVVRPGGHPRVDCVNVLCRVESPAAR